MISVKDMLEIEKKTIESGTPISVLMNNAGKKIADILKEKGFERILIVSYYGNNGGDGLAAAYFLENNVDVLFLGDENKLGDESKFYYDKIKDLLVDNVDFNGYDVIVDSMLGTGTKGKMREPLRSTIEKINNSNAFKVSIDVPTGLNPDTGEVLDMAVDPDLVICFYDIKKGLEKIKDKCIVVDIGFAK